MRDEREIQKQNGGSGAAVLACVCKVWLHRNNITLLFILHIVAFVEIWKK